LTYWLASLSLLSYFLANMAMSTKLSISLCYGSFRSCLEAYSL
jgi:hypothetical protein